MTQRIYFNDRGHPLAYWGEPRIWPVLTVELYLKWYALYLVMPDGSVEKLEYGRYKHLEDQKDTPILWGDHVLYPPAYDAICEALGLEPDSNSRDLVYGRWVCDEQDCRIEPLQYTP